MISFDDEINKLHANRKFNSLPIQFAPFNLFGEIELKLSILLCLIYSHANYPKALLTSAS